MTAPMIFDAAGNLLSPSQRPELPLLKLVDGHLQFDNNDYFLSPDGIPGCYGVYRKPGTLVCVLQFHASHEAVGQQNGGQAVGSSLEGVTDLLGAAVGVTAGMVRCFASLVGMGADALADARRRKRAVANMRASLPPAPQYPQRNDRCAPVNVFEGGQHVHNHYYR